MRERLGSYVILDELGEGPLGAVYRASDSLHSQHVAIRIFNEDLARDPSLKKGLRRAVAALRHPNVAACYSVGEEGNISYAVTDLLEGNILKTLLLEKAPLHLESKLAIMIQIADGLEHAHKNGILHNNLRPGKIHLTPNGIIKIRDFGLPVAALREARAYLAPEKILGKASDERADMFSAGIVFYELLTSVRPFSDPNGEAGPEDLLLECDIVTVDRFPHIPIGFWPIVQTCLHRDPKDRYSNMGQVGAACRELLKDLTEDCDLMLKELRAAVPLLKRAVEMPGSGIRLAWLLRQIQTTFAADAGADHAWLHSLTLSLVEHQGFLRLAARHMPAGASATAIPAIILDRIQAGAPAASVEVSDQSQLPMRSSAISASPSSSDTGSVSLGETGLFDRSFGNRAAGVSLDEIDLEVDYAFALGDPNPGPDESGAVRQGGEVAILEASLPTPNPEEADSTGEERAPEQPLTQLDAQKDTEKPQSQTRAGDARPLTTVSPEIQGDRSERCDPPAVGWTTASFWHLPWGEIRVATVILLVLVAATLWIQARARMKTALEPARLSLNQKRFDEAIAICQRTLAQAPGNPEAEAVLEEAQNGKRRGTLDSLLREAQDLLARGRLGETRSRLQSALKLDPAGKPALRLSHQVTDAEDLRDLQMKVKGLVNSASRLTKQGKLEKAKGQLDVARQLLPEDQEMLAARERWAEKSVEAPTPSVGKKEEEQQLAKSDEERLPGAYDLYRQGRYDEVQSVLGRQPVEDAKSAQPLQIRVADARHALKSYEAALSEQRYEEALNELRKLEQLNPADPRVAEFRRRLESGKESGRAQVTVYRLGAPGVVTLDGQRLDSGGDVENRSVGTGNHLLAVKNDRGLEAPRIQEFLEGQNAIFVYDAASLVLREIRDSDQELLSNRRTTERFPVEHVHFSPAGKCDGELVLSLAGVEYRPRSGAHGFRAPFQSLKFRTEGKTIELYNAANNKEFHTFETAGDEQAEVLNRFWSTLENLPR